MHASRTHRQRDQSSAHRLHSTPDYHTCGCRVADNAERHVPERYTSRVAPRSPALSAPPPHLPPSRSRVRLTVTRPPNCQSALPAINGSCLGPPISPVLGLVSPSNSGLGPLRASGCVVAASISSRVAASPDCPASAALTRRSNSACSAAGSAGGRGPDLKDVLLGAVVERARVRAGRRGRRNESIVVLLLVVWAMARASR